MKRSRFQSLVLCLAVALAAAGAAQSGDELIDLDHPAISYRTAVRTDRVTELSRRLQAGEVQLRFDDRAGYLGSILGLLDIPVESQIAVFSTTSLQGSRITPATPRTIFFNDSTAVAWMEGGVIEVADQDPRHGVAFYLLPQSHTGAPQLFREQRCVSCHYTVAASGVPGLLARSLATASIGTPMPWLANFTTDHRSPLEERWAGWYVTGEAGSHRHLGNQHLADRRAQELPPWSAERTLATLDSRIDRDAYLSPHSDIVALLVFNHQTRMMNLLTRFAWQARIAAHEGRAPATLRAEAAELVDYLLFVDEAPLDRVRGTSGFAEQFAKRGPRDSRGRSLRDLDLQTRLLRYPCSYLIYSDAFDAMPADARELIYRRLKAVLSGEDRAAKYARLSPADRRAILEILRETKTNLPAGF